MTKRSLVLSAIVLSSLLSLPTLALVNDQPYVSVQAGIALPSSKLTNQANSIGNEGDFPKKRLKNSVVYNIKSGKKVYHNTFIELEASLADLKYRNSIPGHIPMPHTRSFRTSIRSISGFANLNYKFSNLNMFTPYLIGGVGMASNRVKSMTLDEAPPFSYYAKGKSRLSLAWQIGAGVLIPVSKSIHVDLVYKYMDLGKVKTSPSATSNRYGQGNFDGPFLKGKLRTSNVLLGVMFNF